jgi:hypothetical protein
MQAMPQSMREVRRIVDEPIGDLLAPTQSGDRPKRQGSLHYRQEYSPKYLIRDPDNIIH